MKIQHHGAVNGVTGSCHQLHIDNNNAILIDCGLFQGNEQHKSETNNDTDIDSALTINFDISTVIALIVTHCHIDHVGRIPYLLAAGFTGPIYATTATAALLPLVIEDALKVGVTRNKSIIAACLKRLKTQLVPLEYKKWHLLPLTNSTNKVKIKLQRAGHILGSAYVEIDLGKSSNNHRVVFSGDLGAPYTPLLPAPKSPYRADTLVIESTYGDKNHQNRKDRTKALQNIIEKAVNDNGVVLIPAFSIGRTQELLYELEQIIHRQSIKQNSALAFWQTIDIIIDSPMAAKFTEQYKNFKELWDNEAKRKVKAGRHPLSFEQLYTVDSHQEHLQTVEYLAKSRTFTKAKPAVVIAASGMCSGGRIVNYLKQFLSDKTADILFVGYQAQGTLGRDIQKYAPSNNKKGGYVYIDGKRIDIKANAHTISGYSAHADQQGLINFVKRMRHKPKHIKLVHGDEQAKKALAEKYHQLLPNANIEIAK
ncbi:MAG: MBL fold metallo-hydrolase [Colwellia sp.]|nr:MBL fold metallo-hydrolase [Colwellia sp.]